MRFSVQFGNPIMRSIRVFKVLLLTSFLGLVTYTAPTPKPELFHEL